MECHHSVQDYNGKYAHHCILSQLVGGRGHLNKTLHTGFFSTGVGTCTPDLPSRDIQHKYTISGVRIQWVWLKKLNSRTKADFGA